MSPIIQPQTTWEITDGSKLATYIECPRQFFYRYVLGWTGTSPNIHLVFGEAFHAAKERLRLDGFEEESQEQAYQDFLTIYRRHYGENQDIDNEPKSPRNCKKAIAKYCEHWAEEDQNKETVWTEIYAKVPITMDRLIHLRMDAVVKIDGLYWSEELKTTKNNFPVNWVQQWDLNQQVFIYTHALYCMFDIEEVGGIIIDGVCFQKTQVNFKRLPIKKEHRIIDSWLWNINNQFEALERDMAYLKSLDSIPDRFEGFEMRFNSCNNYFGCRFRDFCKYWDNPLEWCGTPPTGYKEEHWDPSDLSEHPAKMVIDKTKETS
jgi:hypothetical protein